MTHKHLILLVEDNSDDEEMIQRAFRQSNIANRLEIVRDGAEALDYIFAKGAWKGRSPEDEPCLVLLDLNLPKIGGLEVLRQMRADSRTKLIPVVILSSSEDEQDVILGYELGCNSFVRKRFDMPQFVEAVKTLGLYWLLLNQPPNPAKDVMNISSWQFLPDLSAVGKQIAPSEQVILLVEDNPDDVELTLLALKKNNISNRVVVARDGAEALDYLLAYGAWKGRSRKEDPILVLLDLKLPKIDGLDLLRRMRGNPWTRLTPVVILTSSKEEQDVISGYNLGCNSYIHKPVDFTQFTESVKILGLYWLALNQPPLPKKQEGE